jgi:uncharacterized protein
VTAMRFALSALVGLVTGILSAWGIGGGSLLILYMTLAAGLPQQLAQGINLLYFLPTSLTALSSHLKNGLIDKETAYPAILAGVVTTLGAAFAATAMQTGAVKKIFGVFIIFIGVTELFKKSKSDDVEFPKEE